jgi:allantoate deiminase
MADTGPIAARMMRRLDELGAISDQRDSLTRLYLSPAHARAIALVRTWMQEAGLTVTVDAAGTVCGLLQGADPRAPRLLLGSHIDTVRGAGKYDGCLGVAGAIAALELLRAQAIRLPYPVEVLAFGDEEGVRFPVALTGSRCIAGGLDPAALGVRDADGTSLAQALRVFGLDPVSLPSLARRPADTFGYLELHIEQGPVLEAENLPLGVVTSIAAAARFALDIEGHAGHAGTVPMHLRHDAFAAGADFAVAARRIATAAEGAVATIGRATVPDGAVNVIPARFTFTLDVRAPDDITLAAVIDQILDAGAGIESAHGVRIDHRRTHHAPATACAPWLQQALAGALSRAGHRVKYLPSGAGHDGMAIAPLCPIGMLFVRCRGGISHHPDEHVTLEDAQMAIEILADTLQHLTPPETQA